MMAAAVRMIGHEMERLCDIATPFEISACKRLVGGGRLTHDRTREAHVGVTPAAVTVNLAGIELGYVEPSEVRRTLVDDQELAVIAPMKRPRPAPLPGMTPAEARTRGAEPLRGAAGEAESRPDGVDPHAHLDAARGTLGEALDELAANRVIREDVGLDPHSFACRGDIGQHRVEEWIALAEERDAAAVWLRPGVGDGFPERRYHCFRTVAT
jgi:hypothetical protein